MAAPSVLRRRRDGHLVVGIGGDERRPQARRRTPLYAAHEQRVERLDVHVDAVQPGLRRRLPTSDAITASWSAWFPNSLPVAAQPEAGVDELDPRAVRVRLLDDLAADVPGDRAVAGGARAQRPVVGVGDAEQPDRGQGRPGEVVDDPRVHLPVRQEPVQLVAGRRGRAGGARSGPATTAASDADGLGVTTGAGSQAARAATSSRIAGAHPRRRRVTVRWSGIVGRRPRVIGRREPASGEPREEAEDRARPTRSPRPGGPGRSRRAAPPRRPGDARTRRPSSGTVGRAGGRPGSPGGTRFSVSWLLTPPKHATKAGSSSAARTRSGSSHERRAEGVEPSASPSCHMPPPAYISPGWKWK